MNKHLQQLIELSKYDAEIASFNPKIEEQNKKLNLFLAQANEIEVAIGALNLEVADLQGKKQKNELYLSELKHKLDENVKKSNLITNEKELRALQLEDEIAREQIAFANDEIGRFSIILEAKTNDIEALKLKLSEENATITEVRVAIDSTVETLEKERNELSEKRFSLVATIETKILVFYEKIKRWAHNTAVVPVIKQACYGCYMKINDKTYGEIVKSDAIITCPHCGRIVYKPSDEA